MKTDSIVGIFGITFISLICVSFVLLMCFGISSSKIKNTFIEVDRNSLGCIKYSYNDDYVWKCPKDLNINQIDSRVCNRSGNIRHCKTISEPVI